MDTYKRPQGMTFEKWMDNSFLTAKIRVQCQILNHCDQASLALNSYIEDLRRDYHDGRTEKLMKEGNYLPVKMVEVGFTMNTTLGTYDPESLFEKIGLKQS